MKKHLVRATLGLMGLMGTLAIGVVKAQEINKDCPPSHINRGESNSENQ